MAKLIQAQINKLAIGKTVAANGLIARRHDESTVTYLYRYLDKATGKKKAVALGPGQITLAQALEQADQVRAKVGRARVGVGKDPAAERKEQKVRAAFTVNQLLDQYLADKTGELACISNMRSAFNCHVRPQFGEVSVYDLDADAVAAHLKTLRKRIPETTKHVRKYLGLAFKWAREHNRAITFAPPTIDMPETVKRRRVLDNDEIRDVWQAAGEMGGRHARAYGALVRLLLLTGCRRGEIAGLVPAEVGKDRITIPGERMKAGREHQVPLLPAIDQLLPQLLEAEQAFAGEEFGHSLVKKHLDQAIAARREAEGRPAMPAWVLHDLRRTVRTRLGKLRVDRDVAEAILAHVRPAIEDTYNQDDCWPARRAALTKWHDYLARIIAGTADDVIEMPAAFAVAG